MSGNLYAGCGSGALKLSDVQGSGDSSPLVGQTVTVEGIITLDSRQPGGWRGFYLQQPDGEADGNPQTSDALFVYTDRSGGKAGTRVRVTGQVREYHGLTELTRVSDLSVCASGQLPRAIPVELPWPGQEAPEHLENMKVTLTGSLTLIGHYSFASYGELILAAQPQTTPTELMPPGRSALELARKQELNRLHLDDGRSTRNPDPLPWPASQLARGEPVRAGDRLSKLTGILDYRFGKWRLQPINEPRLADPERRLPGSRPEAPDKATAATLRVVTLNLENYFNGDGRSVSRESGESGEGFANSRGARNQKQLELQTSRLTATLTAMDADIIAVAEMENDDYTDTSAIATLAAALGPDWRFVATPKATGTDAIRTDLLYRADRVRTVGPPRRLTGSAFGYRGRPPVAQLFQPIGGKASGIVRIVVPHFKSKGCGGASGANKNQGDGQGCYARRRTEAAESLVDWLASLPEPGPFSDTAAGTFTGPFAGTLVTGDLNSYAREWPIQRLEDAGLTNLIRARHECSPESCPQTTYQYQGRQGSLDYSMATEPLLEHIVGAGVWPVNAEEFPAIDYQGPVRVPADVPWRSSDHNPLYTDLAL